jgi:hypothetical protein
LKQEQYNLSQKTVADQQAEAISTAEKLRSQQETIARARLASIQASLQDELELYKAKNSAEEQQNQSSYDRGLESVAEYFDKRKALAAAEAQKEIQTLQAERDAEVAADKKAIGDLDREIATVKANATSQSQLEQLSNLQTQRDALAIQNRQKLADLGNKIAVAKVNASSKQAQLDDEQGQKQKELDEKAIQFEGQIAEAQGKRFDAARAQIQAEVEQMGIALRQKGLAPDQVDAMLVKYKSALEQKAAFTDISAQGKTAIADLEVERQDIQLKNTGIVAEQKILQLEQQRLPQLEAIAKSMKDAAVTPEQIKAADDYAREVGKIKVAIQQATPSWKQFKEQAADALQNNLGTFLGSTINEVHGVGDAFRQLGASVVQSLQQIVAQMIATLIITKLLKAAMKGFSSGGSVGGDDDSDSDYATGGFVRGPGSATSDSIPARLSDGEYVVNADAVKKIGLPALEAINRGLRTPAIQSIPVQRYADGGLVRSGGSSAMDLHLGLALDQGLILKALQSKSAGKVILQHLTDNPKAAGRALQRAQ